MKGKIQAQSSLLVGLDLGALIHPPPGRAVMLVEVEVFS